MSNFTTNTYEIKRGIVNFTKKVTSGLNKPRTKFIMDMVYGIAKSKSCLISEIARSLDENIKLNYTIERLCDNISSLTKDEYEVLNRNYLDEVNSYFGTEPIAIFDDSDISKRYGKKFEDLDEVIDASNLNKEIVPGYHICEGILLTEKEKQPISIYSKIYSCKSKEFISKNEYTIESVNTIHKYLKRKANYVFDRGYDDNKIITLVDNNEDYFVIRINDKRNFLFKGKKKNCHEIAIRRKGKVKVSIWFQYENKECYVSHTRVKLPHNKKDYELVIVYGLSEDKPMKLITNREIKSKEDLIKVVRLYFSRWRIEEYFRAKKQEYDFENIRIRTLKSINNLNLILKIYLGYIGEISEKINTKLLGIKILEASKSLRSKVIVWLSQIARGIGNILERAATGIKEYQNIRIEEREIQLTLKL